jgi:spore coat protein A, manganese oxidase
MVLLSKPVSRRRLLKSLGTTAAGAALFNRQAARGQSDDLMPNVLAGVRLEPFVDPLFIPPVLRGPSGHARSRHHRIRISEVRQKLHRDLPEAVVWGFEGSTPGPIIEARRGQAITIDWVNRLPSRHRLLIDHTLCGAGSDIPEVRTTIHLHGGHVSPNNDGYPEDWVTPGQTQRTVYPNEQVAAMLWYHDHAMGITRLNAMMGLAGMYFIREPDEEALALPSGGREIPILLQDRILDARGQLAYPVADSADAPSVPEFFGTHILVNGRVSPFLEVEPRLYRLRLLNASNARVFRLTLEPEQAFFQIGTDGGLLSEPVARHELLIAPGERCDVLLDFRGREGRRIMMVNNAPAPYPGGGAPVPGPVIQFRVFPRAGDKEDSKIPDKLASASRLRHTAASKTRRLTLMEMMPQNGQRHTALLDGKRFTDPISEDPVRGTLEIWEFVNTTADAHPIHLHAVHFQILDRCPFDTRLQQRTSQILLTRRPTEPPQHEQGWKDTVLCPPGQITRIITPFTAEPGRYVWHCHMLEHEDNEMMRPYVVRG